MRWTTAATTLWQCDEIPLLVRSTGLCGHVTNERSASEFQPSLYTFRAGAIRSLSASKHIAAIHTTTGFWANLTMHLFGASPAAGRLMPLIWSMVAILVAAWGGWMVGRSVVAACVAALLVSLSPHGVAYAAQARGYAEAMALAPLLLIALEWFRRRPSSAWRGVFVMMLAIQLSLTVYTAWVYWVAPTLCLAVRLLPSPEGHLSDRRAVVRPLVLIVVAVFLFMTMYTLDRYRHLAFTASNFGMVAHSLRDVLDEVWACATHLTAAPVWMALFGVVGAVVVWRSALRWWLVCMAAGVMVPVVFAVAQGSPGFPRNFGYLVVPLAILTGVGANALLIAAHRRFSRLAVTAVVAIAVVGGSASVYAGLSTRVRHIILPDWGDAVTKLDREAETVGPRWFCHSLANHWQINWYRSPESLHRCMAVPVGGSIEVVMGTQRDEHGSEIIFQYWGGRAIVEQAPPSYVSAVPIAGTTSGVDLRRWRGTRLEADGGEVVPPDEPMLLLVSSRNAVVAEAVGDCLLGLADRKRPVRFKTVAVGERTVASCLIRAGQRAEIVSLLRTCVETEDIRCFRLTSLAQGSPDDQR